jgi:hypothetical protein
MSDRLSFLYPKHPYHGQFTPENLTFNANLQEFAQRIGYISALETGGHLTPAESFEEIRQLWKQLKRSAKHLGVAGNLLDGNNNL